VPILQAGRRRDQAQINKPAEPKAKNHEKQAKGRPIGHGRRKKHNKADQYAANKYGYAYLPRCFHVHIKLPDQTLAVVPVPAITAWQLVMGGGSNANFANMAPILTCSERPGGQTNMTRPNSLLSFTAALSMTAASHVPAAAQIDAPVLAQTVYVPAYSRVYLTKTRSELMAATLTIHNVDPNQAITLQRVEYYDQDGTQLTSFLEAPLTLSPFASKDFLVPMNDTTGGTGANFIAAWSAELPAQSPIFEALIVGGSGTTGLAFKTEGKVIKETPLD